jgi:hypothetical protein
MEKVSSGGGNDLEMPVLFEDGASTWGNVDNCRTVGSKGW